MKVIFIAADSLKSGACGFEGGTPTPYLDSLAEGGTVFQNMFASGAWTTPSIMSMLTGMLGHRIGIARWRHPFPAALPNLFTAFAAAGFKVNCFHPYPRWGFLTLPDRGQVKNSQDPDEIIRTLRSDNGQDQFVFIHHWWTHLPYHNRELSLETWHRLCDFQLRSLNLHPAEISATLETSYLKTVHYLSQELLPRYLDAATAGGDDVLLVLTGDHGETWGASHPEGYRVQNVYDLHGRWITDETIHVPLLFYGRNIPAGQQLTGIARGVDLAPTICDLAGIPWPGPPHDQTGTGVIARALSAVDRIGVSLSDGIVNGLPLPANEVFTVSSHNAFVPRTYPDSGPELWRMVARRTEQEWLIWDGVEKTKSAACASRYRRLPDDAEPERFAQLETMRLAGVDPGPLAEEAFLSKEHRDSRIVEERLRSLGYLE